MSNPLLRGDLPEVTLDAGCTITFEALDPNTGATITGVVVSNAALYGVNVTDDTGAGPLEPLPPIYVSLEDEPAVG